MASPTRIPIGPSGEPLESDNIDDVLTYLGGGEWEGRPTNNAVESVFGRTGAVTAQAGDYTDAQVSNTSDVDGETVAAALNSLATSASFAWGTVSSPGVTAIRFFTRNFATPGTSEPAGQIVVGRACTITTMRVSFGTASPTATFTLTLRVNGAPTALSVVVPATQTTGVATGSIVLAPGDRIGISLDANLVDTVSTWNCSVIVF